MFDPPKEIRLAIIYWSRLLTKNTYSGKLINTPLTGLSYSSFSQHHQLEIHHVSLCLLHEHTVTQDNTDHVKYSHPRVHYSRVHAAIHDGKYSHPRVHYSRVHAAIHDGKYSHPRVHYSRVHAAIHDGKYSHPRVHYSRVHAAIHDGKYSHPRVYYSRVHAAIHDGKYGCHPRVHYSRVHAAIHDGKYGYHPRVHYSRVHDESSGTKNVMVPSYIWQRNKLDSQ